MTTPIPAPDPAAHLTGAAIHEQLSALPPAPQDRGRVALLVARDRDSGRTQPARAHLTVNEGMPGDRWVLGKADPDTQLAVMAHDIGTVIANGQSMLLFGDNLVVDLDLSEANLPVGSRVQIGEAVLEVTPMPHTGCKKYAARFGRAALKYISARERRILRLRGIYLKVIDPGAVWLDAEVRVLSRSSAADTPVSG